MTLEQQFTKMEARRKQLLATFANRSDEELNRTPQAGAWSAIQVVQHLLGIEAGLVLYLGKKLQNVEASPKSGLKNWFNLQKVRFFLAIPIKIKAPAVAANVPSFASYADTLAQWDKARNELFGLLRNMNPNDLDRAIFKHPLAGYLNLHQMLTFIDLHVKHHEKQVARALAKP